MGTKGETIRVRVSPRSRAWQPVILAMALVASLVLTFAIDRMAGSFPGTATELPITWPIQQHGPQAHMAGMHHAHPKPNQPEDETCFFVFEATSPKAVQEVARRAGCGDARVSRAIETSQTEGGSR